MTISFDLSVTKDSASKFNLGVKSGKNFLSPLDDIILILKLRNGPDHYITVEGEYVFSSFGMPQEVLCNARLSDKARVRKQTLQMTGYDYPITIPHPQKSHLSSRISERLRNAERYRHSLTYLW